MNVRSINILGIIEEKCRWIVMLSVLCVFFVSGLKAQVGVESTIDSVQIFVGEQTMMHTSATIKPGQKVVFKVWQPQQMLVNGIEVVEVAPLDTTDADNGYIKVSQHLTLTSFEDTLYYIPAQKVKIDGKEYASNNLALKVLTIDVDTLHPNQFFGPKDVQNNPFQWKEWSRVFWLSMLAAFMYLLCWGIYLRLKSNKPIKLRVRIVKRILPHQKALSEIEKLKEEKTDGVAVPYDLKGYYTQLTDALRKYIEERFGFNAMEMTSAEIITELKKEKDQSKIEELTMLFETADLVKFAKYTANFSENDRNLVSAIDFINTTKQENLPTEERIEPSVTEQEKQMQRMRISLKWGLVVLILLSTVLVGYVVYQLWDILN